MKWVTSQLDTYGNDDVFLKFSYNNEFWNRKAAPHFYTQQIVHANTAI
jgi:hypothetical protein